MRHGGGKLNVRCKLARAGGIVTKCWGTPALAQGSGVSAGTAEGTAE